LLGYCLEFRMTGYNFQDILLAVYAYCCLLSARMASMDPTVMTVDYCSSCYRPSTRSSAISMHKVHYTITANAVYNYTIRDYVILLLARGPAYTLCRGQTRNGRWRLSSSSVVVSNTSIYNVTHQESAHDGGPVVLRPDGATPCFNEVLCSDFILAFL